MMLEILALCSCACITTCIWCAVAVLTCPRVVNVPSTPSRSEDRGICQLPCPSKFPVQNLGEYEANREIYPQPFCPNVAYPIWICPVDCTSSSASVWQSNSSGSNSTPRVKNTVEVETLEQNHNDQESSSQCSTYSDHDFTVCSNRPPKPPPRLRRNRLKSILKSKFKKREDEGGMEQCSISNCAKFETAQMKSDKVSETEFSPWSVGGKSTFYRSHQEPVFNSVPLFKMICKTCRLEKQICKCNGHPILRPETEFEYPMRFYHVMGSPADSETMKYHRASNSNSNVQDIKCLGKKSAFSELRTTPSMDSSNQTVFLCDQSTCVCEDEYNRSKSKNGLRRIRKK